jgi:hypothetical protein
MDRLTPTLETLHSLKSTSRYRLIYTSHQTRVAFLKNLNAFIDTTILFCLLLGVAFLKNVHVVVDSFFFYIRLVLHSLKMYM